MEADKKVGSSSSSTCELFGSKDSSSSHSTSSGLFGSLFPPQSKAIGRDSVRSELIGKMQDSSQTEAWKAKPENPGDSWKTSSEADSQSMPNKDMTSMYQDQVQPCTLSSSIFYGGQDVYSHPQNSQTSSLNAMFKKDGVEDDSGSASRGNWWQGSLYY